MWWQALFTPALPHLHPCCLPVQVIQSLLSVNWWYPALPTLDLSSIQSELWDLEGNPLMELQKVSLYWELIWIKKIRRINYIWNKNWPKWLFFNLFRCFQISFHNVFCLYTVYSLVVGLDLFFCVWCFLVYLK